MMRMLKVLRRPWLTLLLGAQLAAVSAPLADARLDADPTGPVHVEAQTDRSCAPVHLHEDCVLCQFIAQRDVLPPAAVRLADVATTVDAAPLFSEHAPATPATLLQRGRSPPAV